jgi:S-disulfanyl-L-cysteine oxidoreductase SoxD
MIAVSRLMIGVALVAAAAAGILLALRPTAALSEHFADAQNTALVSEGKRLYVRVCSGCHGRRLRGQLLWQVRDQYFGRRAPAHDQTGHTWQHSDEDLFEITKFGRFRTTPPEVKSYMPAYEHSLSDDQILATIAYIKATWPLGLRVSQALLNPNYAGMPRNAHTVEWRLPPNCQAAVQRAGAAIWVGAEGLPQKPAPLPQKPALSESSNGPLNVSPAENSVPASQSTQ